MIIYFEEHKDTKKVSQKVYPYGLITEKQFLLGNLGAEMVYGGTSVQKFL